MPNCCTCVSGTGLELEHKKHFFVGNSWNPCPYSTQSDDIRSRSMLGGVPLSKSDHTDHLGRIVYMSPKHSGDWGYECTFSGCPFVQTVGAKYFHR